tara:strand:- start:27972 stop:29651 length:1680 start_codon:yes stop_codon:yes gene_type:complete
MNVPINDIRLHGNVRSKIDKKEDSFKELVKDIDQNGLIQPLVVYRVDDTYYLIAGHRRLEALKELALDKAAIYERPEPNGDFTQLQVSENTMRKDLTLYEEIMAFKSMTDTKMTIAEVAGKFGHSRSYVIRRVEYGNLIPALLKPETFDDAPDRFLSSLRDFAKHHKSLQKEALEWVAKENKCTVKEYCTEHLIDKSYPFHLFGYPGLTSNKLPREEVVNFCDTNVKTDKYGDTPEERFVKLQKEYGYKVKTTPVLFQDEEFNDYCADMDFIKFIWIEVYPEEAHIKFNKLKIDKDMYQWSNGCSRAIMPKLLRVLYRNHYLITTWNGNWDEPIVKIASSSKSSASSKDQSDKPVQDKYSRQTKKFGKAVATGYLSYLKKQLFWVQKKGGTSLYYCGGSSYVVDKWVISQKLTLNQIDVPDHLNGYNLDRIRKLLDKDYTVGDLAKAIYKAFVLESMNQASFKSLNKLAKSLKLMTLKEWFKQEWDSKDSDKLKLNVLSCFSLANLNTISKGKKIDIVEYAIQKNTPFPFMSIFSSKEAEWDTLSLKHCYLDKNALYSA